MSSLNRRLMRLEYAMLSMRPRALLHQARQGSTAGFAERLEVLVDKLGERVGERLAHAVMVKACVLMSDAELASVANLTDPDTAGRIAAMPDDALASLAAEGGQALQRAVGILGA